MFKSLKSIADVIRGLLQTERRLNEIKVNQGRILSAMQVTDGRLPIWKHEFKVFSQWGEDGILQYLTKHLDISNRTFIEFGVSFCTSFATI